MEDPVIIKQLIIYNEKGWESYLEEKLINLKTVNIDILNENIQKQKEAIHNLENDKININTTKIFSVSNMIVCIVGISGFLMLVLYFLYKKKLNICTQTQEEVEAIAKVTNIGTSNLYPPITINSQ